MPRNAIQVRHAHDISAYLKSEQFSRACGVDSLWHAGDSFDIRMGEHKLSYLLIRTVRQGGLIVPQFGDGWLFELLISE